MRKIGTVAVLIVWFAAAILLVGEIDRHAFGHDGAMRGRGWLATIAVFAVGAALIVRWRGQRHAEREAKRAALTGR